MKSVLLTLAAVLCLGGCASHGLFSSSYTPPTGPAIRNWPPSSSQSMPSSVNSMPAGAMNRY